MLVEYLDTLFNAKSLCHLLIHFLILVLYFLIFDSVISFLSWALKSKVTSYRYLQ